MVPLCDKTLWHGTIIEKVKELQVWLALKWVKANQSICLSCEKQSTCKRNQEKQKKCKFYIMKGDENNENI